MAFFARNLLNTSAHLLLTVSQYYFVWRNIISLINVGVCTLQDTAFSTFYRSANAHNYILLAFVLFSVRLCDY